MREPRSRSSAVGDETGGSQERDLEARRTLDRALAMLALSARSTRELHRRLVLKGEPEPLVASAIERLQATGLLDDAAYARAFARSKLSSQGFSRRRLQQELLKRGVAPEVASAAIQEVLEDEQIDEGATIERVARKKLRMLEGLDEQTQRRRVYAYLARRGYELDDIRRVMSSLASRSSIRRLPE